MAAVKFTQLGQGEFIFTIPEAVTLGEGVIRVAIIGEGVIRVAIIYEYLPSLKVKQV